MILLRCLESLIVRKPLLLLTVNSRLVEKCLAWTFTTLSRPVYTHTHTHTHSHKGKDEVRPYTRPQPNALLRLTCLRIVETHTRTCKAFFSPSQEKSTILCIDLAELWENNWIM